MLSPAGAAGPLLNQPAKVLVTVAMGAMLEADQVDVPRLRELVVEWWDRPALRRTAAATDTTPGAPLPASQAGRAPVPPKLGVKPVGDTLASTLLPPQLRQMAERMGGVPTWWNGSGTAGEVVLAPDVKRQPGKIRRSPAAPVGPPEGVEPAVMAAAVAEVEQLDRPAEAVIADGV